MTDHEKEYAARYERYMGERKRLYRELAAERERCTHKRTQPVVEIEKDKRGKITARTVAQKMRACGYLIDQKTGRCWLCGKKA